MSNYYTDTSGQYSVNCCSWLELGLDNNSHMWFTDLFKRKTCECPEDADGRGKESLYSASEKSGMTHKPGQCKGTNEIKAYRRDGKILHLCSCCNMPGDVEV